jgi:two-component system response regulator DesR
MPRVLLVDDDVDLLSVYARWCASKGMAVETATSAQDAAVSARMTHFDVAVVDISLGLDDGILLAKAIALSEHPPAIILITGFPTLESAIAAVKEAVVVDYLTKPLKDLGELSNAILRAARIKRGRRAQGELPHSATADLTGRETEIARLLMGGLASEDMARALNLSKKTVKNYLSLLYAKLGVRNRAEAIIRLTR